MLVWQLRRAGVDVRAAMWGDLIKAARAVEARYLLLAAAFAEINTTLEAEGITPVWLKGAALARTVYPDPALRPMLDLDLLVTTENIAQALAALIAIGYHHEVPERIPAAQLFDEAELRRPPENAHHHLLIGGLSGSVPVELHFQLLVSQEFLAPPGERWFWSQTTTTHFGDLPLTVFRPEAALLYLSFHAALHHAKADFRLVRLLDLHLLITHQPIDWRVVVEQAIDLEWTQAVDSCLRQTTEYFGTLVPPDVLLQLQQRRPASEDPTRLFQFYEKKTVLDGVLREFRGRSTPERLAFLHKSIFPPRAYMRTRYNIDGSVPVLLYYPYRWATMLLKVLASSGQLMRRKVHAMSRSRHTES